MAIAKKDEKEPNYKKMSHSQLKKYGSKSKEEHEEVEDLIPEEKKKAMEILKEKAKK